MIFFLIKVINSLLNVIANMKKKTLASRSCTWKNKQSLAKCEHVSMPSAGLMSVSPVSALNGVVMMFQLWLTA